MPENLRMRGACANEDPELFFPAAGENTPVGRFQRIEAKKVCARCPVINACLAAAMDLKPEYGVWGGMTEGERRELMRRRAALAAPLAYAINVTQNGSGRKITTLHTLDCGHIRRFAPERKRPVNSEELSKAWADAIAKPNAAKFCRACKPWTQVPGLHEAEELYRPIANSGEMCARCGHRALECARCDAKHPQLGGRINGVPYCHTHVEQPSCYTQQLHEEGATALRKTRVS